MSGLVSSCFLLVCGHLNLFVRLSSSRAEVQGFQPGGGPEEEVLAEEEEQEEGVESRLRTV